MRYAVLDRERSCPLDLLLLWGQGSLMTRQGTDGVATLATDVLLSGDILRVAHRGLPILRGEDATAQLAELSANHERFRGFLNEPPHGNLLVNACLIYPSSRLGVAARHFLAFRFAFAPFAGTALMASAVVLADEGWLTGETSSQPVLFETANQLEEAHLFFEKGLVRSMTWVTRPPRILLPEGAIVFLGRRQVRFSLVSSRLPYVVVTDADLGIPMDDLPRLAKAAVAFSAAVGSRWSPASLGVAGEYARYLIMVAHKVNESLVRAVWISDQGEAARSAGSTGALAVLAALRKGGGLPRGGPVSIEAPRGAFECDIVEDGASVPATPEIVSRHELLSPPLS